MADVETPGQGAAGAQPESGGRRRLGEAPRGYRGTIVAIDASDPHCGLPPEELERRLIELGFLEDASVEIVHEGLFGRDPIAVRVDGATVALRRREAMAILVT